MDMRLGTDEEYMEFINPAQELAPLVGMSDG